jgi:hypothetical protein
VSEGGVGAKSSWWVLVVILVVDLVIVLVVVDLVVVDLVIVKLVVVDLVVVDLVVVDLVVVDLVVVDLVVVDLVDVLVIVRLAVAGRLVVRLTAAGGVVARLVAAGRFVVGVAAAGRRDGGHLRPVWECGSSCADGFLPTGEFDFDFKFEWWIVFNDDWGFFLRFLLATLFGRGEEDVLELDCYDVLSEVGLREFLQLGDCFSEVDNEDYVGVAGFGF